MLQLQQKGKNMYKLQSLEKNMLFKGINIEKSIKNFRYKYQNYKKGDRIFNEGDTTCELGIIVTGSIKIYKYSKSGDENIISVLSNNEIFLEAFTVSETPLFVNVSALEDCEILFLHYDSILTNPQMCRNLLKNIASKALSLNQRVNHMTKHSIAEKLMSYLLSFNKKTIKLNMNRNELAGYLGVDRSALSREISRLISAQIIKCDKNIFTIISL